MISAPAAQIVNAIAEGVLLDNAAGGERVPSYGPTMAVTTAIIALGIAITTAVGPEKRGSHFESAVVGQQTAAHAAEVKNEDLELGRAKSVESDEHAEYKEETGKN